MKQIDQVNWQKGSQWFRWDPHIHTPATLLNNQFGNNWNGFIEKINNAVPAVSALGITEYGCIHGYREFRKHWLQGKLPSVALIFPNVELRITTQTKRGSGINIHLLFSPEEEDHEGIIEAKLSQLVFSYLGEKYRLDKRDLIQLGRQYDPGQTDEHGAFCTGINQFKVELSSLIDWRNNDSWLARNCLVAVASGQNDGTSGLQEDSGFSAHRTEIERFADIIFSAKPSDRAYWAGERPNTDPGELQRKCGPKPCLHGSDAHRLDQVLNPTSEHRCWIKGELIFEALRQTLFEPTERVFIGPSPPDGPASYDCIEHIRVIGAPWFPDFDMHLNKGLVAIIGPKGSGKTALADIIARTADAFDADDSEASFLYKAADYLENISATATWGDGTTATRNLGVSQFDQEEQQPRIRYLSQQFVEQLCSSDGLGTSLIREIEAVVFRALDETERLGTRSFAELRESRITSLLIQRSEHQDIIRKYSNMLDHENGLKANLPAKIKQEAIFNKDIDSSEKERQTLLVSGKEERTRLLSELDTQYRDSERRVANYKIKAQKLRELKAETERASNRNKDQVEEWKNRFSTVDLNVPDWDLFKLQFAGDVNSLLEKHIQQAETNANIEANGYQNQDLLTDPPRLPLCKIRLRLDEVRKELGIDQQRERRYIEIQQRLQRLYQERERLQKEIEHILKAEERIKTAKIRRRQEYCLVFQTLVEEEKILSELYSPLARRLRVQGDVVSKLEFYVHRRVDLDLWAERGEGLLDLRKAGPLQGRGTLAANAKKYLLKAWKHGSPDDIAGAMEEFIPSTGLNKAQNFLSRDSSLGAFVEWLFSTDHIHVEYGIRYDGVELRHLSPGARGIVLLILYLAIDEWDSRPLLVDQPEENLDPQSVFEDLVGYFRESRRRRQVIIVTHNANLVVNTDADQIIIADSKRKVGFDLPKFSYEAGALEDCAIRDRVCRILEGGERAFRQRERRYALSNT